MKRCNFCKKILVKTSYYRIPQKYCNKVCYTEGMKTGITTVDKICERCESTFKWQVGMGKGRFCSYKCAAIYLKGENSPNWKADKKRICEVCEESLSNSKTNRCRIHATELMKYKISGSNHYNWRSKTRSLKGSNNPAWKGGVSSFYQQIRTTLEYEEWRKACMERDNYTCQDCGQVGGFLEVDHIKARSLILRENNIETIEQALNCDELWNLDNGRTLCKPCHIKTDTYGWKMQRMLKKVEWGHNLLRGGY